MSSVICYCGTSINLNEEPLPYGFKLISQETMLDIVDKVMALCEQGESGWDLKRQLYLTLSSLWTPGIMSVIECPYCGRLIVYARSQDHRSVFCFQREDVDYPEKAPSLRVLAEWLRNGDFLEGWQDTESDTRSES
jgi:hypothetical protein